MLCVFGGFEAPHFFLAQSRGLMGFFCSVVQSFVLPMLHPRQDLTFGRPITPELIGDDHSRHIVQPFEKFAEKSLGGLFVPSALHQDIKHVAILIHGSPEEVFLATYAEDDLVQVPFVTTLAPTTAQFIRIGLSKFQAPLPHGFIGHDDPTLRQKLFDIAETE